MAENFISSIKVGAVSYNIKDTEARTRLSALESLVESGVQIVIADVLPTASADTLEGSFRKAVKDEADRATQAESDIYDSITSIPEASITALFETKQG